MYDRFLIKKNNKLYYCYEMAILIRQDVEIIQQERTFDGGKSWIIIDEEFYI